MNKVWFGKKEYAVAGKWDELTSKQIWQVCRILHQKMMPQEAKIQLLFVLLKNRPYCQWLILHRIDSADLANKLFALTHFITAPNLERKEFLTKNPFPKIRVGLFKQQVWYGAQDRLRNISFEEFCEADALFMAYAKTQKPTFLHRLIAVLYRPKAENYDPKSPDFQGEIREKFNSFTVDSRLKLAQKISPSVQLAIYLFFAGARTAMTQEFPDLFQADSNSPYDPLTWAKVLRKVAGNLSRTDDIAQKQARFVFFDLQESLKEVQEREESYT